MLVVGINPVAEALENIPNQIQRVYFSKGKSNRRTQELIDLCRLKRLPFHFESSKALDRRASGQKHQGVIAELTAHHYTEFERVLRQEPNLLLLLDGVEDPRNLGAVIRTAEAAGVDAVLLPQRRSCGITNSVLKSSAGAALHLPICRIGNVALTLKNLKDIGFWVIGLDPEGDENMDTIDVSDRLVLVVGSENKGLRRLVKEKSDFLVRLPMLGRVSSLNLSVAAAVLLYRIVDRRLARPI